MTGRLSLAAALRDPSGQTLVEYGLVLLMVAVAVVAALAVLGVHVLGLFAPVSGDLP